jgi:dUTP pyrophosphatase
MEIKIRKINKDAKIPSYAHPGDAGMDLFGLEDFKLMPGKNHIFSLGIALEIPQGFVGIVKDKSGLSAKYQIHVLGGVFDSGYRGEYLINLINLGTKPYEFKKGDKIAQLIIFPIASAELYETKELSNTSRGEGHYGSTGR